jgi:PAS domain S-box-containing protein
MSDTEHMIAAAAMTQFSALVESSGDAIISVSLSGTITSWNRGATAMYGYSAEEAVGRPIVMLIPDDRLDEDPDLLAPMKLGERIERPETVRIGKDGRPRDVSLTISPIIEPDGRLIGLSGIARDISRQKCTEEALRRTSRYFDLSRDMVCTAGLDGYSSSSTVCGPKPSAGPTPSCAPAR